MKKIILSMLVLITVSASAQEKAVPFISGGAATSYLGDISIGGEFGMWGIESPLSYSLTVYGAPKINDWYIGIKPYFTILDKPGFSCMVYSNPQWALNRKLFIIEQGLGFNLNLSRKILFGWYFGAQFSKEVNGVPLLSGSIVYLFRKK
jgi:hypothetical protein